MLVCLDCNELFWFPEHYVETHGLERPPFEEWDGCPYCGGNYTVAHVCDMCNNHIDGPYIKLESGERICENCYTAYELGEED